MRAISPAMQCNGEAGRRAHGGLAPLPRLAPTTCQPPGCDELRQLCDCGVNFHVKFHMDVLLSVHAHAGTTPNSAK